MVARAGGYLMAHLDREFGYFSIVSFLSSVGNRLVGTQHKS